MRLFKRALEYEVVVPYHDNVVGKKLKTLDIKRMLLYPFVRENSCRCMLYMKKGYVLLLHVDLAFYMLGLSMYTTVKPLSLYIHYLCLQLHGSM